MPKAFEQLARADGVKGFGPYAVCVLLSMIAVVSFSVYAANKQMADYSSSVFKIDYGFGPVIRAIVEQHRFGSIDPDYGWWSYAHRMPLIPLLGAISFSISPRASVFMALKNLLFWPFWIVALIRLKRKYSIPDKWLLVTPLCLLLAPYNLSIAGRVNVEEGFIFAMLALLFSLLLTMDGFFSATAAGALIAVIYLTKSSMLLLCGTAAAWAFIRYRRTNRYAMVMPLTGLCLAVLGWGLYINSVSGVFAFGANASSWNGWNFYKGNNSLAYARYPRLNLDSLDHQDGLALNRLLPTTPVHNEWELNKAQLEMGKRYVSENPGAVIKMDLKKVFVACCDLGEAPALTAGQTRLGVIVSNLVNHLLLFGVVSMVVINITRRRVSDAEILAILLTVALLLPYFGGFLYSRHLVPLYGLMGLTLAIQLARWSRRRESLVEGAR